MNTCDTCKWWVVHTPCGDFVEKIRSCNREGWPSDDQDDNIFFVEYGDAALITGPKFGCIHHEFALANPAQSASE